MGGDGKPSALAEFVAGAVMVLVLAAAVLLPIALVAVLVRAIAWGLGLA